MSGEVRTVSSTGAAKGVKPEAFDLIPSGPILDLAKFYSASPVDFRTAESWSSVFNYVNDQLWKFWLGEDTDPETGLPRLISAGAGCFALLEFLMSENPTALDDRPSSAHPAGNSKSLRRALVSQSSSPERFDLIPYTGMVFLARHYGAGASKYAAHNWAAGYEWSKPFAALMRHLWAFWNGEDIDAELDSPHLIAAAWHCLTISEFATTHPEFDDRPVRGTQRTNMQVNADSTATVEL